MEEIYSELQKSLLDVEITDVSKLSNIRRLRKNLKELALSDNLESLNLLENIISKYVRLSSGSEKTGLFVFHCSNKSEIYNALYLDSILDIIYEANTPVKNNFLHQLGGNYRELVDYKIKAAIRMFTPEYVFENYSKDFIEYPGLSSVLKDCYGIKYYGNELNIQKDTDRNWDRRWASFLLENNNGAWAISVAFPFVFDDDTETWSKLLSTCKIPLRDNYDNNRLFRQDCTFYCNLLKIAYRNNHPEKDFHYAELIHQGCPKDLLDKCISK